MTTISLSDAPRPQAGSSLAMKLKNPALLLLPAVGFLTFIYVLPLIDLIRISISGPSWLTYFERVFAVPLYWESLVRTMQISVTVAFLCLLFGYPTALLIHRTRGLTRALIATAIVLPYFIAILIRTYAWMVLLGRNGVFNRLLLESGLIADPLPLLNNFAGVLIGMVHVLLPYMVLPIYGAVRKVDPAVVAAAEGLGASSVRIFWRVYLPLTLNGIFAGAVIVFVLSLGFFITPALLGGGKVIMIAVLIEQEVHQTLNWPFAGALAFVLLAATLLVYALAQRFTRLEAQA